MENNRMGRDILYNVEASPDLGRFLVAAREIQEGEIIISEEPLLSAPSDSPRGQNGEITERCLGCSLEIDARENQRCSACFFPCCSTDCEKLPAHADSECKFFVEHHTNFPLVPHSSVVYKSIMCLRALLFKTKDASKFRALMKMEAHFELRRDKPNASVADEKVIENIMYFFGTKEVPDSDEIRRISGIIDVNAHLLPQQINGKPSLAGVCHIFEETSLLCHSCVPNAAWTISTSSESDTILVTRASACIPKGSQICVSYDVGEVLYGTLRRVIPMEISGLFVCRCPRCIDPTELGTHLSTLICDACKFGYVLPMEPSDSFSPWICQTCSSRKSDEEVLELLECLESEIEFPQFNLLFSCVEESIEELEDFKSRLSGKILHPNHYILLQVNFRWIKQHTLTYFQHMTPWQVQSTFLPLCRQLIQLTQVILPGASEFKAILQFHLCQGLVHLKVVGNENAENDCELKKVGQEAINYFQRNNGFETFMTKMESILRKSDIKEDKNTREQEQ